MQAVRCYYTLVKYGRVTVPPCKAKLNICAARINQPVRPWWERLLPKQFPIGGAALLRGHDRQVVRHQSEITFGNRSRCGFERGDHQLGVAEAVWFSSRASANATGGWPALDCLQSNTRTRRAVRPRASGVQFMCSGSTEPLCELDEIGQGLHLQLPHDLTAMHLDVLFAGAEVPRDLLV